MPRSVCLACALCVALALAAGCGPAATSSDPRHPAAATAPAGRVEALPAPGALPVSTDAPAAEHDHHHHHAPAASEPTP